MRPEVGSSEASHFGWIDPDAEATMEWFQQNWFWLAVLILFMWMHVGGHGCGGHGGHGGHSKSRDTEPRNGGREGIDANDRDAPSGGSHDQH